MAQPQAAAVAPNAYLKIQCIPAPIVENVRSGFVCKKCPLEHPIPSDPPEPNDPQPQCPRASGNNPGSFSFEFNRLPEVLQQRFVQLANVYEKSKLQQVSKKLNNYIRPEQFTVTHDLIAYANDQFLPNDRGFWNVKNTSTHVNPGIPEHENMVRDLIVNRKFNGHSLPDNWLTRVINQNVTFYLTTLHIDDCKLTGFELKSLMDYGALEKLFIFNVTVEPPPKAYELALWTTNIKKFLVRIKNFKCEEHWVTNFAKYSSKREIKLFELDNLHNVFNANDLDKFIRSRVVNEKTSIVRLYFNESSTKMYKKKVMEAKLDRMFAGVFKRVPKVQYDTFDAVDRFIVDSRRPGKSRKVYFFVNCRAIDTFLAKAEVDKKMQKLSITN